MTYEEWKEFLKSLGSIALMPHSALREPCPKCGQHAGYEVTNDYYAYCRACNWGTATEDKFTAAPLTILDPSGNPERYPQEEKA